MKPLSLGARATPTAALWTTALLHSSQHWLRSVQQRAAAMPVSDKVAAMFAAQEARNAELDRRLPEIAAKA